MNRRRGQRLAVVIVTGLAMAAAFPPFGFWPLAPVGIAGFTYLSVTPRLRGAALWGSLCGLIFFGILLIWITTLGPDAWVALSLFCASWFTLTAMACWAVGKLPLWPLWVSCIWILSEALRTRIPWGGFGWGRWAFSQPSAPTAGLAALGGAPLVSFACALAGALLAYAVINRKIASSRVLLGAGTLVITVGCLGLAVPTPTAGQTNQGPARATMAVVQGSVPRTGLDVGTQRAAVLNNHVIATVELAGQASAGKVARPEAVIWPENSSDLDPLTSRQAGDAISAAARAIDAPILVGGVTRSPNDPNKLWNIGIVWNPRTGPGSFYVKQHPVPFGEYIPYRSVVTKVIKRYSRVPFDFEPGTHPGVLQVGPARVGDVICFEVADDAITRNVTLAGARAITVQTNNATYSRAGLGGSSQPEQQFAMARLRAIEHGRSVLVAATSGISAIVNPAGDVVSQAPLLAQANLVADVPLRDSLTVADHVKDWPEFILAAIGLVALMLGIGKHLGALGWRHAREGTDSH